MTDGLARRIVAEVLGTALLLAAVVGSGVMGERLAQGNDGIALLANSIATGSVLFVLILMFAPISGGHFNPLVTLVRLLRRELPGFDAAAYIGAQVVGAIAGVWLANAMFDLELLQHSTKVRTGTALWLSEMVASFGLITVILAGASWTVAGVAAAVALYITSAYWFTASTSFANPAVTLARSLTDTFAGIAPGSAPMFIVMQAVGALLALVLARWLFVPATKAPNTSSPKQPTHLA
jgi:glycerol uptake facilitator-like aquaporin